MVGWMECRLGCGVDRAMDDVLTTGVNESYEALCLYGTVCLLPSNIFWHSSTKYMYMVVESQTNIAISRFLGRIVTGVSHPYSWSLPSTPASPRHAAHRSDPVPSSSLPSLILRTQTTRASAPYLFSIELSLVEINYAPLFLAPRSGLRCPR